ncbi:MAG: SPFH/Band 7/PHB domain protein [Thiomargarita sp.]|nr:SPFH/Band 7/PHB domain protein [Thiomargarita sp.]
MTTWIIIISLLLIFTITIGIFASKGIYLVDQGNSWIVERFGKYKRTLEPGLRFIFPLIDTIRNRINMREQVLDVQPQDVITKDNAIVKVDGIVFFKIFSAEKATYGITGLEDAIMQLTLINIRRVMGSMTLDESLSERDAINRELLSTVDKETDPWGIKITRIEIKDISPPADLVEAMARQMKAEREKRAAILEAEGKRKAEVENAEGHKRSLVLKAEGEKAAAILRAEGKKEEKILHAKAQQEVDLLNAETRRETSNHDAYAREKMAEAEAKATSLLSNAIAEGDIQAINYFIAQKYVEALQSIASADNQKLIMIPLEASNLIGSISGIGDIAKEVLSNKNNSANPFKSIDPKRDNK